MSAPTFVTVSTASLHSNLASQMSAAIQREFVSNVQKMLREVDDVFSSVRKAIRADALFEYINLGVADGEILKEPTMRGFWKAVWGKAQEEDFVKNCPESQKYLQLLKPQVEKLNLLNEERFAFLKEEKTKEEMPAKEEMLPKEEEMPPINLTKEIDTIGFEFIKEINTDPNEKTFKETMNRFYGFINSKIAGGILLDQFFVTIWKKLWVASRKDVPECQTYLWLLKEQVQKLGLQNEERFAFLKNPEEALPKDVLFNSRKSKVSEELLTEDDAPLNLRRPKVPVLEDPEDRFNLRIRRPYKKYPSSEWVV